MVAPRRSREKSLKAARMPARNFPRRPGPGFPNALFIVASFYGYPDMQSQQNRPEIQQQTSDPNALRYIEVKAYPSASCDTIS